MFCDWMKDRTKGGSVIGGRVGGGWAVIDDSEEGGQPELEIDKAQSQKSIIFSMECLY